MLVKVYRVEHRRNRRGPYQLHKHAVWTDEDSCMKLEDMLMEHSQGSDHPMPYTDGIKHTATSRYGFRSMAALEQWFDGWLDWLKEQGFIIRCYLVDVADVLTGRSGQVQFSWVR